MEFLPEKEMKEEEEERPEEGKDSPFVKMVDLIIKNAIKKRASDVHIEAQENQVRVRNRVDGVLQDSIKLPKWTQPIIISRIKVLAGMDIAEKRLPKTAGSRLGPGPALWIFGCPPCPRTTGKRPSFGS